MALTVLIYLLIVAVGIIAFIYAQPSKRVRFSDNVDVRTYRPACSLSAYGDDSSACLDEDLADAKTKRSFTEKMMQDHDDYLNASDAFFKYVTNDDAVIKIEPTADPFTNPECYQGQTLESIYEQQLTKYKAR